MKRMQPPPRGIERFFDDSFGVWVDNDRTKAEKVILSFRRNEKDSFFTPNPAEYLRVMPLHRSQVFLKDTPEEIVPARVFAGNKPTTSILAPALTPSVVGELIALYEHITFTQGIVWGIDSFDQWGVELGKKLALEIAPAVQGDEEALAGQDASTRGLITRYRSLRR